MKQHNRIRVFVAIAIVVAICVMLLMLDVKKDSAGDPAFKTYPLPGEVGTISLPGSLKAEAQDESTLLAYLPGSDAIFIRVSSISVVPKDNSEDFVLRKTRASARKKGHPVREVGGKIIVEEPDRQAEEDGRKLVGKTWTVAMKNTIVIVSASILASRRESDPVLELLTTMPQVLDSVQITQIRKILDSKGKKVEFTQKTLESAKQTFRVFNKEDRDWLDRNLKAAKALGIKYGTGAKLTPPEMDQVFSRWMSGSEEKEDADMVANALGAAFGQYFVDKHGFTWMVVTDQYGTCYSVRHKQYEVTSFPVPSVQKRIASGDKELFKAVSKVVLHLLAEARKQSNTKETRAIRSK